ncbi:MAG: hypothetical protein JNL08_06925 [Planctomycetes bacterium]|nr:hypothetical protein [Planctomycetota bacterium]
MKTAALLVLTLLPALAAQQEEAKGRPFVLEAGETKLTEFVDRCASHLGWNILSSAQELASCPRQEIRTQNRIEVDHDGCIELLSTMLARGGFVLTELDAKKSVYEILAMEGPRGREILNRAVRRTPEQILAQPTLRMPVSTVVELKHINAPIAVNALRPFFASTGGPGSPLTIGSVGNISSVLVTGMQDQVALAIDMVRQCDVPPPPEAQRATTDRIEALERRVASLEKKLKAAEAGEER